MANCQDAVKQFEDQHSYQKLTSEEKAAFVEIVTKEKGWEINDEKDTIRKTENLDFPYVANKTLLFGKGDGKLINRNELYLHDGISWQMFSHSGYEFDSATNNLEKKYSRVIWETN